MREKRYRASSHGREAPVSEYSMESAKSISCDEPDTLAVPLFTAF